MASILYNMLVSQCPYTVNSKQSGCEYAHNHAPQGVCVSAAILTQPRTMLQGAAAHLQIQCSCFIHSVSSSLSIAPQWWVDLSAVPLWATTQFSVPLRNQDLCVKARCLILHLDFLHTLETFLDLDLWLRICEKGAIHVLMS